MKKKQESSDYKEIRKYQLPLDIDKAVDLGRNQKTSQEYEEFEAGNDFTYRQIIFGYGGISNDLYRLSGSRGI